MAGRLISALWNERQQIGHAHVHPRLMQQRADLAAVVRLVIEEMRECVRKINPECQDNGSKERTMDSLWDGFLALSATFAQAPPIDCFGCQRIARVFSLKK